MKHHKAGKISREGFIEEVIFELSLEGEEVEGCSKQKEKHEPVLETWKHAVKLGISEMFAGLPW